MFEAAGVSFAYAGQGRNLLEGVSLHLTPGQLLGIQGPSGSGKTTLARILGGYVVPSSGHVRLNGAMVSEAGGSPVQVIFQHAETAVDPRWKIRRILTEGWKPDEDTMARFGVRADWLDRYPHELSGGELQRVAIVRALVPQLRVLIADELTAMHDAIGQARVWRALLEIVQARRIAVLAVSHDAALLQALGATCMTLRDGRLHS